MARDRILQIYRGTTAQNDVFTGAQGELTMDTARKEIRIHDGSTAGGNVVGLTPGFIALFAGSTAPAGWLVCDGSAVSRTTYAKLFAVIGTTYGSGDGNTTFNIPDSNERFVVESQNPSADNNYTWYRLYNDGWVEQGGIQNGAGYYARTTVTLPIAMADNTYQAFGNIGWPNESGWYAGTFGTTGNQVTDVTGATTNKTTTSFMIQVFSKHNWYVCGMAATAPAYNKIQCIKY